MKWGDKVKRAAGAAGTILFFVLMVLFAFAIYLYGCAVFGACSF